MVREVPAGWNPDPSGRNEVRYWDGVQWTASVATGGVQAQDPVESSLAVPGSADRLARWSLLVLFLGFPVGLVGLVVWQSVVETSATIIGPERVRGWESVVRELPATLLFLGVVITGLVLAVIACRRGPTSIGRLAIWLSSAGLLLALMIIVLGSAETVMTTRSATVKWMLFPLLVGIAASAFLLARHAAQPSARRGGPVEPETC